MATKTQKRKADKYTPSQLAAVLDLRQGSRSRPVAPKKVHKQTTRSGRKAAAIREEL